MTSTIKEHLIAAHTAEGRWVYTSACPVFEGDTNNVRAYDGSIHSGWENSAEFETSDAFYAWAKAECAQRNTLEAAASKMLEALRSIPDRTDQANAEAFSEAIDDWWKETALPAIAKAEGRQP